MITKQYTGNQRGIFTRPVLSIVYHWLRSDLNFDFAFEISQFLSIDVGMGISLKWYEIHSDISNMNVLGLTSPKPERGCVKTDCFDEALCREYNLHSCHYLPSCHHHLLILRKCKLSFFNLWSFTDVMRFLLYIWTLINILVICMMPISKAFARAKQNIMISHPYHWYHSHIS